MRQLRVILPHRDISWVCYRSIAHSYVFVQVLLPLGVLGSDRSYSPMCCHLRIPRRHNHWSGTPGERVCDAHVVRKLLGIHAGRPRLAWRLTTSLDPDSEVRKQ